MKKGIFWVFFSLTLVLFVISAFLSRVLACCGYFFCNLGVFCYYNEEMIPFIFDFYKKKGKEKSYYIHVAIFSIVCFAIGTIGLFI